MALGDLSYEQSKITEKTMEATTHLLNYAATKPNANIQYHKSGMILHIHSDGLYLYATKSLSCVQGHFSLS